MGRSISPEEIQLLVAGYVLNDLSAEEIALIEELLDNPETVQSVEEMQRTLEQIYAPVEVRPAPHVREAVMRAFQATLEKPPTHIESTSTRLSREASIASVFPSASPVLLLPRWAKALGAAAAVLIIALGTSNYILWRSLQAQQQRQLPESRSPNSLVVLQPTQTSEVPLEAVVAIDTDTLQGTLTTKNLPPLEPGKVYVLWTVLNPNAPFTTDTKNAVLTQVFTVAAEGNATQAIVLPRAFQDPGTVKAIAITIEDAIAPQQHRSPPILIQQL